MSKRSRKTKGDAIVEESPSSSGSTKKYKPLRFDLNVHMPVTHVSHVFTFFPLSTPVPLS